MCLQTYKLPTNNQDMGFHLYWLSKSVSINFCKDQKDHDHSGNISSEFQAEVGEYEKQQF